MQHRTTPLAGLSSPVADFIRDLPPVCRRLKPDQVLRGARDNHRLAYFRGGSREDRREADIALLRDRLWAVGWERSLYDNEAFVARVANYVRSIYREAVVVVEYLRLRAFADRAWTYRRVPLNDYGVYLAWAESQVGA